MPTKYLILSNEALRNVLNPDASRPNPSLREGGTGTITAQDRSCRPDAKTTATATAKTTPCHINLSCPTSIQKHHPRAAPRRRIRTHFLIGIWGTKKARSAQVKLQNIASPIRQLITVNGTSPRVSQEASQPVLLLSNLHRSNL